MQAQTFLGIGLTTWNIIEKYFMMNFLSSLFAKNDFLSLLVVSELKIIFHWKDHLLASFSSLFRLLAIL